jgi:hypothetical protein
MPTVTPEVCIDWDAEDWSVTPNFSEAYDTITDVDGVNFVGWKRGKEREEGNAPAGTCEIRLKPGLCDKYSPFTSDSDLQGKVRPWLPVRVREYHDSAYTIVYTGFISRIHYNPHPDVQLVIFYCTDGTDLLARQIIAQDTTDRTYMSDGDAMDKILDAAGWSRARRNIDKDGGGDFVSYPASTAY